MAIRFRRRLRVAPGVYINLNKHGLSTTIGKRGASLTLNSNGVYGNIGLPGTGLSYRTKLIDNQSSTRQESLKSFTPVCHKGLGPITYFKQLPSLSPDNKTVQLKRHKGTGSIICGSLCVLIAILLWQSGSVEPLLLAFVAIFALCAIIFLWVGIDAACKYSDMDMTNIENLITVNQVLEGKKYMDPLRANILEETKKYLEIASQIDTINASIQKLQKKKQTQKVKVEIGVFNEQIDNLKHSLNQCGIPADWNLTPIQLEAYQNFCYKMRQIKEYNGIWMYLSDSSYTMARITEDTFGQLISSEKVPTIITSKYVVYFYPKYIIRATSNYYFDILEWSKANFVLGKKTLPIPQSEIDKFNDVKTSFLYETKNGLPDKRYTYNPMIAEATVGIWELSNFEDKYYFNDAVQGQHINNAIKRYINLLTGKCIEISAEYNDALITESTKYVNFYSSILGDKAFRQYIKKHLHDDDKSENAVTFYINTFFEFDLINCFNTLKGSVDFNTKEGLALLYIWMKLKYPEQTCCFETLYDRIDDPDIKSYKDVLEKRTHIVSMADPCEDFLYSYTFFSHYDKDKCYQSLILLYRIMSVIAKADGIVSEVEAGLLGKIMDLQNKVKTTPDDISLSSIEKSNDNDLLHEPLLADIARFIVENHEPTLGNIQKQFNLGFEKTLEIRDFLSNNGINPWMSREDLHNKLESMGLEDHYKSTTKQNATKSKGQKMDTKLNSLSDLDSLIGLTSVKKEVKMLTNFIKIQQQRVAQGMKVPSISYHCVFTGNPGTGKTTVARIIAGIYRDLGILQKGHLVETDRAGLVAEYVGQTAVKTNKIIDEALDGVLFIDEAYSLSEGGANDFGKEAIATLLKRMEDDRNRLVVILAGYTNEMKGFIDINPGLQSRFNRYIDFPDYDSSELIQIFESNLKKFDYKMNDEAKEALSVFFENAVANKDKNFGNARFARNIFEKALERQANRLAMTDAITSEALTLITKEDLPITD